MAALTLTFIYVYQREYTKIMPNDVGFIRVSSGAGTSYRNSQEAIMFVMEA